MTIYVPFFLTFTDCALYIELFNTNGNLSSCCARFFFKNYGMSLNYAASVQQLIRNTVCVFCIIRRSSWLSNRYFSFIYLLALAYRHLSLNAEKLTPIPEAPSAEKGGKNGEREKLERERLMSPAHLFPSSQALLASTSFSRSSLFLPGERGSKGGHPGNEVVLASLPLLASTSSQL